MANKEERKPSFRGTLLTKLHLQRDLSLDRARPDIGRVKWALATFAGRMKNLMAINILLLVFLTPAILIFALWLPQWTREALEGLNFGGNLGVGYPGAGTAYLDGTVAVFEQRQRALLFLMPAFTLFGIGLAGAFYLMRNYSWRTPVKHIVHFGRGIKKYGIPFAIAFSVVGALVWALGHTILQHMINAAQGTVSAGNWVAMLAAALASFVYVVFLMFFLPHIMCYKVKWRYHFKNAAIFSVSLSHIALINVVFMIAPLLLFLLPGFGSMLMYILLGFVLFGYYVLWFTSVGQYAFDNFIEKTLDYKEQEYARMSASERKLEKRKSEAKDHKGSAVAQFKKKKKKK